MHSLPPELAPEPAGKKRGWFEQDRRTHDHARHCLPLMMANSLGYTVRSPGSFRVTWDGDWNHPARVTDVRGCQCDDHAALASFTLQPGFVPRTSRDGDFIWVKPLPNVKGAWFTPMEAVVEAWWNPGRFGLVCLLNRPGSYRVERGDPVAQLVLLTRESALADLEVTTDPVPDLAGWEARRHRPGYTKDGDYWDGKYPDGRPASGHVKSWRVARRSAKAGTP